MKEKMFMTSEIYSSNAIGKHHLSRYVATLNLRVTVGERKVAFG